MQSTGTRQVAHITDWRSYWTLCKPGVVALIVFTAIVGIFLASPGLPSPGIFVPATLGIALAAASAAAINHVVDQKVDAQMSRTEQRPLPQGRVSRNRALGFALLLGVSAMLILSLGVNGLTAVLTLLSLIGYAVIYTLYLKRATPQNIVIGGAAGAAPPLLGWVAVTGQIDPEALLLFLIIFTWTPPHFWALAIHRMEEYRQVDIPMLPVTHGLAYTRLQILLYTVLLFVVTLLPYSYGMSGTLYLAGTLVLNLGFLIYAVLLYRNAHTSLPMRTFGYSIVYLMGLFALLLLDHYVPPALQQWLT